MYNQNKDELIQMYEMKGENGSSLMFSIFSYNKGPKKLAISRAYQKKDGTVGYSSSGRLTVEELIFFKENLPEILSMMSSSK